MKFSRATMQALVAIACLGAAGCRDRSQVSDATPLRFWNGFSGPDGATMKKIVDSYNQEHPDAKFEMQIIPWATYYDKVTLGMAFGGAPDVFILQVSRLPQYADAGALEPIGDMVKASGLGPNDFVKTPYESGFWKGTQYALPLDCWPLTMYYNRQMFRDAGIEKPPTNLAEFLDAAHKLTKRDATGKVTQYGFELAEIHNNLINFLDQHGANIIDENGKRSLLDSPESLEAVNQLKSFIDKERIMPAPAGVNAWDDFRAGRAAMVFQGIYMIADLQKSGLDFGAAPVPILGPKKAVWGGSHMLCIPVGLPSARRAKAFAFIKYLSDHSLRWAGAGQCPVRTTVLDSPEFQRLDGQYQASKQLGYVQYEPQSPVIGQVMSFADASWEAILMNGEPPESTYQTATRRIESVLERR